MKKLTINDFPKTEAVIREYIDEILKNVPESAHPQSTTITFEGEYFNAHLELDIRALSIEYGRGPGKFPPPDAIRAWVEKKGIVPRQGRNGKVPSIKQLCFLISSTIADKGTQWFRNQGVRGIGRFYDPALKLNYSKLEEKIGEVFVEELLDYALGGIEGNIM